jgi:glycosyltransferase involved in cell wall biosynthesis
LCRTLSDAYGGAFVAWFADRRNEEFPYRSSDDSSFAHQYLSEVGYWKLFKALKADSEAVVILGGWSAPMTNKVLLMTMLLRLPTLVWADHPHPRKRSWIAASTRKLYLRFLTRIVSGFLACGNPTVEHLASLGIKRSKITNFPYWVELPLQWSVPKRCLDEDSANRPLRLLAIGRLVPVKRFEVAIEAVALANKRAGYQIAELVLAGDGPERSNLEAVAQALGSDSRARFTGWLETQQVWEELTRSDALVVPSSFEPYGVVVLEGMAGGRPVLASTQVVAALDRDDGTGAIMLHPIGESSVLAEQITLLASDADELKRAAIAARRIADNWPPAQALTILNELLGATRRGRMFLKHRQGLGASSQPAAQRIGTHKESIETRAVATD